jgi:hypothetical protein
MSKWTDRTTPPDTITAQEVMERLGVSPSVMTKIRHDPFSTMPLPVNDDKKYFLYDREPMLEWIERYLAEQPERDAHPGLDNKMAQDFIRKGQRPRI